MSLTSIHKGVVSNLYDDAVGFPKAAVSSARRAGSVGPLRRVDGAGRPRQWNGRAGTFG